jgi:hypothetical protein
MNEQQQTVINQAKDAVLDAITKLEWARHLLTSEDTAPTIGVRIYDAVAKLDDIADDLADYPEEHTQYMKHLASLGFTWEEAI